MSTPSAPQVTSVICQSGVSPNPAMPVTLQVVWEPTGDYTGPFTIDVQDTSGTSYGTAVGGINGGIWASTTQMQAGGAYVVIVKTSDPNVFTDKISILVTPFQSLSTSFDGTTVGVTWQNPQGPRPAQVIIRLRPDTSPPDQDSAVIDNNGAGTIVPNTAILPPAQTWYATVAPVTGIATGPWASPPIQILRSLPQITKVVAKKGGNEVGVTLLTPALPGYTDSQQFNLQLYADNLPYPLFPAVTVSSVKQPEGRYIVVMMREDVWPLPDGFVYRFVLRQVNAAGIGPEGPRQPFPTSAPYISGISYLVGATQDSIAVTLEGPAGISLASGAYAALIDGTGTVKASAVLTRFSGVIPAIAKGAAAGCKVTAATVIGVATGLVADDTVAVLTDQPVLSSVVYDGTAVTAVWSSVNGASGYTMSVWDSGQLVASGNFGQLTGTIEVPRGHLSVSVTGYADRSIGGRSAKADLLVDPPAIPLGVVFNKDGTATVTFSGVPADKSIKYQVLNGGVQVKSETLGVGVSTVNIPSNLLPQEQELNISAALVLTGGGLTATGPWTAAVPLITQPATGVTVDFDGKIANISWQPSPSLQTAGYKVTVRDSADAVQLTAVTVNISAPIDCSSLAVSGTYNVVVEPVSVAGASQTGVRSAPAPLFQPGLFLSASASAAAHISPFLDLGMSPYGIKLYFPDLFKVKPTGALPTGPVFTLAEAQPSDTPFAYVLTMPTGTGSAWDFAQDAIRPAVKTAYDALLTWLDTNQATGYGIHLVTEAIGRAMPQTFAETLLYGCGLDIGAGVVNLRPGHILKVEFESYQYQGTAGGSAGFLNGFVGSNVATYEIGSGYGADGRWLLNFDSFLNDINQYMKVPSPQPPSQPPPPPGQLYGAGGVVDMYYDGFPQPYGRIVYPNPFFGQGNVNGSAFPYYNVAIVTATSLQNLQAITAILRSKGTDYRSGGVLYFRGRTMVSVCQRIWIDDAPIVAPIGYTAGNVLEMLGSRPPHIASPLANLPLKGITLRRMTNSVVSDPAAAKSGLNTGGATPVRLDWNTTAVNSAPHEWLDLPLMPGDKLSTGGG